MLPSSSRKKHPLTPPCCQFWGRGHKTHHVNVRLKNIKNIHLSTQRLTKNQQTFPANKFNSLWIAIKSSVWLKNFYTAKYGRFRPAFFPGIAHVFTLTEVTYRLDFAPQFTLPDPANMGGGGGEGDAVALNEDGKDGAIYEKVPFLAKP